MRIKFTLDSTCDLPKEMQKELDLSTMPLIVSLGEDNFLDGETIEPSAIYAYVEKTGKLPKTAARNPEDYKAFFESFLREGYDAVVHFNISSEVSASYQNASLAIKDMENVHVINSMHLSTGTAILCFLAKRLQEQGKSVEEIVATCNEKREYIQTSFVVETLDYLHKGGRCSGMQRFGANLLKLRPYIKMREGKLGIGGKYRGAMKKALTDYIQALANNFLDYDDNIAFITHSGCDDDVLQEVSMAVQKHFVFKNVYKTIAGSTITSHCGRGTLGLLFLTNSKIKD